MFETIFSTKIGSSFVFSAFLCAMFLCTSCITVVDNTIVNAQPLSTPVFEKIAPYFRKEKKLIWFFTFVFCFLLFHIFVDFRVPLPPRLGQIGPICDRV